MLISGPIKGAVGERVWEELSSASHTYYHRPHQRGKGDATLPFLNFSNENNAQHACRRSFQIWKCTDVFVNLANKRVFVLAAVLSRSWLDAVNQGAGTGACCDVVGDDYVSLNINWYSVKIDQGVPWYIR